MIIFVACVVVYVSMVEMFSHAVKLGGLNVNMTNGLCNMNRFGKSFVATWNIGI